jgi:hypothetical protein
MMSDLERNNIQTKWVMFRTCLLRRIAKTFTPILSMSLTLELWAMYFILMLYFYAILFFSRPDHTLQDLVYKLVPGLFQGKVTISNSFLHAVNYHIHSE